MNTELNQSSFDIERNWFFVWLKVEEFESNNMLEAIRNRTIRKHIFFKKMIRRFVSRGKIDSSHK